LQFAAGPSVGARFRPAGLCQAGRVGPEAAAGVGTIPAGTGPASRALAALGRLARRLPPSRVKARAGRALAYALGDPAAVWGEVGGLALPLRPGGRTTGEPFWNGTYEEDLVALLGALLRPGATVADLGANVGLIGLRLADRLRRLGGGGQVVCCEPVPANLDLLRAGVARNGLEALVQVVPAALSDRAGTLLLVVEARAGRSGNATTRPGAGTVVEVPTVRLDDLWAERGLPPPDLVKVDVEGAEVACLGGATRVLSEGRPVIFGEFNAALMPEHGTSFPDAMALLTPLGYTVYAQASATRLVEVPVRPGRGDVLLVPAERREAVAEALARAGIVLERGPGA
jgi:FkbM family methyltransferase